MKIAVIGAGIVGISSANWLKKYGQDVTLYDMNDPGSQASKYTKKFIILFLFISISIAKQKQPLIH